MNTPATATTPSAPAGVALYLAVVQFLFVTTWSVYVIFLPRLLESAGLSLSLVPLLLMADQLVFMAMDIYVGIAADRAQRTLGRVGPLIMAFTAISCVAFLLLPFAASSGTATPALLLALTFVWAVTSSALRAPPWVLLGKYAATPAVPRLNMLMLWGLAVGSAAAPYLTVALKESDARLPFVLSSLALLAATAGIVYVERRLRLRPAEPKIETARKVDRTGLNAAYLLALALVAIGFQLHYSVNSAPQYSKLVPNEMLQWLMPVFWIGFAVAMTVGNAFHKRYGALRVMAGAAVGGAAAIFAAAHVMTLSSMVITQAIAGGAWGCILNSAFAVAITAGRTATHDAGGINHQRREGYALGLMFAVLAAALLTRLALVASGATKHPDWHVVWHRLPEACWLLGGLAISALAYRADLKITIKSNT